MDLPDSGIYALLVRIRGKQVIAAGALGRLELRDGHYVYVGRASKGLKARLGRHASLEGKLFFWHVDHLLSSARLLEIWVFPLSSGECELAARLESTGASREGLQGFGSSDCRCRGHLLYLGTQRPEPLEGTIMVIRDIDRLK